MVPIAFALAASVALLPDRGIYPELDSLISITLPADVDAKRVWLRADPAHRVLTLYHGDDPLKAYPIVSVAAPLQTGTVESVALHAVAAHAGPDGGIVVRAEDYPEIAAH